MKKLKKGAAILLLASVLTTTQTSCVGSFGLFNKILDWNQGISSEKWGQELLFLALWILPVYEFSLVIDVLVLNSIEFWTGDNPIAMKEGDSQIKIVKEKGNMYEITATKNKFNVKQLKGNNVGEEFAFVYNETEMAWYLEAGAQSVKIGELDINQQSKKIMKLYTPDKVFEVEASEQGVAAAKNMLKEERLILN